MLRKTLAATLVLILTVSASAVSFGSFSGTDSKTVSSNTAEFSVSVFNMGENPVDIEITSENVNGAEIIHPDSMTIAPSEITRSPGSNSEWFLTKDGRYVSVQSIPVEITRQSSQNQYSFDVSISASAESEGSSGSGAVQNIVQTRSYSFEATFEESSSSGQSTVNTGQNSDNQESTNSRQSSSETGSLGGSLPSVGDLGRSVEQVFRGGNNQGQDSGTSSDSDNQVENTDETMDRQEIDSRKSEGDKESNSSDTASQKEGGSITGNFFAGANQITIILFAAMAGTVIYMVKVI